MTVELHCRYPYLARLRNRAVLDAGVLTVMTEFTWAQEGCALATGYDDPTGRYVGLALPHEDTFGQIIDTTLLVSPTLAQQQRAAEVTAQEAATGAVISVDGAVTVTDGMTGGGQVTSPVTEPAEPEGPRNVRFYGVHKLDPERYGRDWTKVATEVLQQLAAADGAQLEVRIEITATKPDGFPDDKVRVVTENAKVLKFETFGFEDL